jgi:predicted TPR repeat methyltransferase
MTAAPSGFEAARQAFLDGVAHFQTGRLSEAEKAFEASLAALPGRASTLLNLGATRLKLGRAQEALQALDEGLAREPADADGHCHRGQALAALGRDAEALAAFDSALAAASAHPAARLGKALALARAGRPADVVSWLRPWLASADAPARAWMIQGQALQVLGRHAEALPAYDEAVRRDPALGEAWGHRGHLLKDLGRDDEARASLRRAIAAGGDVEVHRYALAALEGVGVPGASPEAYVRGLFDGYAEDFERHLVEGLRYRAHETVLEALREACTGTSLPLASALDLGCGTGLCGPRLARMAMRVVGVDLSPTMLSRASTRGCYAELVQQDIAAHVERTPASHDLVVATDVFIYVGALERVFGGLVRVMRPGALFGFSVERADERTLGDAGFELRRSLRYAHGEGYLRRLAAAHGMTVCRIDATTLRVEQGVPIEGLVVVLRRG